MSFKYRYFTILSFEKGLSTVLSLPYLSTQPGTIFRDLSQVNKVIFYLNDDIESFLFKILNHVYCLYK